jgi:hypothetical protein
MLQQRFRDSIFPKLILKSPDNNLTALISLIIIQNNKSITCLLNFIYNLSSCVRDTGLVANEWNAVNIVYVWLLSVDHP